MSTFRDVYSVTSRMIRELCDPFLESLTALEVQRNGHAFAEKLRQTLAPLLERTASEDPLPGVTVRNVADPRREILHEFFIGLGVESDTAGRYANSLIESVNAQPGMAMHWRYLLSRWNPLIYMRARQLHSRVQDVRRDAARVYEPHRGADQAINLLQRFPDLANQVYAEVGLQSLQAFPPQVVGTPPAPGSPELEFMAEVETHLEREWWSNIFSAAALAVVSIAVIAVTAGVATPVVAGVVGAGIGTVSGGALVLSRAQDLAEARAAVAVGAMTEETAQGAEDALAGAWTSLAVDIATGGIAGRFGGTRVLSSMLRGAAISGGGGGVAALVDPSVWRSENTVGLVVEGVVIGTVAGALGAAAGAGLAATLRNGSVLQFAMNRRGRAQTPPRVRVSAGSEGEAVDGVLLSVDSVAGTAVLGVGGRRLTVEARNTIALDGSDLPPGYGPGHGSPQGAGGPQRPDRPMRPEVAHRYRHVPFGGFRVTGTRHIYIQGDTAEQVRLVDIRIRQLQRFPAGRELIRRLDDALERTAQHDVDAEVTATANQLGWTGPGDQVFVSAERQRLLQNNRRNRRVVIRWIDGEGRIQCDPLRGETAHRSDAGATPGEGSGSVVHFDPDRWAHAADDGNTHRPPTPAIVLGHELVHAHRHATGTATTSRVTEEMETIGLVDPPDWAGGPAVSENDLLRGWAALQQQVARLRTSY